LTKVADPAVPFVDLSAQQESIAAEIRDALSRVMRSAWFILGPEVEAFEREFAPVAGTTQAVGVASGTDALTLSLWALGVGPGDEVITTPLTAAFTALAISRTGARPVFADVEPRDLTLAAGSASEKITPRTKALIPVHLYGNVCDMPAFMEVADRAGIAVVEDACQAHGAKLGDRPAGSWGATGCFSFYPTKNLGALGDGGLIATNDGALAGRLRRLRNGGQENRYVHQEAGFNSRLDELQAAVLRAKLTHLAAWNERRRALASLYRELLEKAPLTWVEPRQTSEPACHLMVARVPERDRLQEALRDSGVQTLVHYPIPVHLQPAYRDLGQPKGSCPEAERAAGEILSLPLYPELRDSQVERVARVILKFYR
jgi:dTDP-4-amino-4,6-dideoxygalactose transaminase